MNIIMEDKIILNTNYKTNKINSNFSQDMLTKAPEIFITIREFKTHTRRIEIIMNSKIR